MPTRWITQPGWSRLNKDEAMRWNYYMFRMDIFGDIREWPIEMQYRAITVRPQKKDLLAFVRFLAELRVPRQDIVSAIDELYDLQDPDWMDSVIRMIFAVEERLEQERMQADRQRVQNLYDVYLRLGYI